MQRVDYYAMSVQLDREKIVNAVFTRLAPMIIGIQHHQQKAPAELSGETHQSRHQHHAGTGLWRPVIHQHQPLVGIFQHQLMEIIRRGTEDVRGIDRVAKILQRPDLSGSSIQAWESLYSI